MQRPDTLVSARVRVLEHVVTGGQLPSALALLCRETEAVLPSVRCGVRMADPEKAQLHLAAAPSLPPAFRETFDAVPMGSNATPCGTAVSTGARVIVENVMNRRDWEPYREQARSAGVQACWSQPVLSKTGEVMGTLVMYSDEARAPSLSEVQIIESQAQLAGMVMERGRADQALRESELTSRALLEGSPVCNKIIDMDSRLRYMSTAGVEMLKIPDIDAYYGTPYPNDFYAEADREVLARHLEDAKTGTVSSVECPVYSLDGNETWLNTTFVPARNEDGDIAYVIATSFDITTRKRAEVDAYEAKAEAEFANRAKSAFLANMSHDLRTPLNAIIGFTEMMETEAFGPLGDRRYEEYANAIRNSGNLLVSLINDILDISKIEAGKYALEDEVLDMTTVIARSVEMLSSLSKSASLDIITDIAPDLPRLRGDSRSLTQVLNNLLSNAVKFTPPRGRIVVAARQLDGCIEASVRDTGVGMRDKDVAKVFEPFEQADRRTVGTREGTGLGLHLCRKLMQLHGGDITLQSRVGDGTTVVCKFPADRTVVA